MKKIVIAFFMLLTVMLYVDNPVFAEDVYAGENNEYTFYVSTESISANYSVRQGNEKALYTLKCSAILIPKNDTLMAIRKKMLDNDIEYQKENYSFTRWYNRINDTWCEPPAIMVKNKIIWCGNSKELYGTNDIDQHLPLHDNSDLAIINQKILSIACQYLTDHPNLVKTTITQL